MVWSAAKLGGTTTRARNGTAGLPPFVRFSTSYHELDCAVPGNCKGVERSLRAPFLGEWRGCPSR